MQGPNTLDEWDGCIQKFLVLFEFQKFLGNDCLFELLFYRILHNISYIMLQKPVFHPTVC